MSQLLHRPALAFYDVRNISKENFVQIQIYFSAYTPTNLNFWLKTFFLFFLGEGSLYKAIDRAPSIPSLPSFILIVHQIPSMKAELAYEVREIINITEDLLASNWESEPNFETLCYEMRQLRIKLSTLTYGSESSSFGELDRSEYSISCENQSNISDHTGDLTMHEFHQEKQILKLLLRRSQEYVSLWTLFRETLAKADNVDEIINSLASSRPTMGDDTSLASTVSNRASMRSHEPIKEHTFSTDLGHIAALPDGEEELFLQKTLLQNVPKAHILKYLVEQFSTQFDPTSDELSSLLENVLPASVKKWKEQQIQAKVSNVGEWATQSHQYSPEQEDATLRRKPHLVQPITPTFTPVSKTSQASLQTHDNVDGCAPAKKNSYSTTLIVKREPDSSYVSSPRPIHSLPKSLISQLTDSPNYYFENVQTDNSQISTASQFTFAAAQSIEEVETSKTYKSTTEFLVSTTSSSMIDTRFPKTTDDYLEFELKPRRRVLDQVPDARTRFLEARNRFSGSCDQIRDITQQPALGRKSNLYKSIEPVVKIADNAERKSNLDQTDSAVKAKNVTLIVADVACVKRDQSSPISADEMSVRRIPFSSTESVSECHKKGSKLSHGRFRSMREARDQWRCNTLTYTDPDPASGYVIFNLPPGEEQIMYVLDRLSRTYFCVSAAFNRKLIGYRSKRNEKTLPRNTPIHLTDFYVLDTTSGRKLSYKEARAMDYLVVKAVDPADSIADRCKSVLNKKIVDENDGSGSRTVDRSNSNPCRRKSEITKAAPPRSPSLSKKCYQNSIDKGQLKDAIVYRVEAVLDTRKVRQLQHRSKFSWLTFDQAIKYRILDAKTAKIAVSPFPGVDGSVKRISMGKAMERGTVKATCLRHCCLDKLPSHRCIWVTCNQEEPLKEFSQIPGMNLSSFKAPLASSDSDTK
ncbi:hypothetical protein Ciccas_004360 [Cichlidogyrus casuarinus]|uniref:Uncharacterized protein n=1 Tax=Cichlidogyrus casuarinus TaxID=1844966 RepID=A0ABD2QBP4_9PLAT